MFNRNSFLFSNHVDFCDKDCVDRKVGCHSSCKRYIERKAEHDKNRADMKKIKAVHRDVTGFEINSYKNMKKSYHRK